MRAGSVSLLLYFLVYATAIVITLILLLLCIFKLFFFTLLTFMCFWSSLITSISLLFV